ncbi:MAG: TonB-dependent receptor [Acidobacteriaceae bacterium]|nr:TonB-dependent receptor [Acidobacteriaceae bacterium]
MKLKGAAYARSRAWLSTPRILALAGLICCCAPLAVTQTTAGGSIRGHVSDATQAPVSDVVIFAQSPDVGGVFRGLTDEHGDYVLNDIPPANDYSITGEKQGFERLKQDNIVVRAGANATADLILQVGAVSQTVQVNADANLVDLVSSEQTADISGETMRAVPLTNRREWSDFLQLTPGVTSASSDAYGGQTYFVRGSENENMATLLDGADIGAFLQNWPSNYISISTASLADIQIKTGGADASSPAAMGSVINIASPTGSDQFHGSLALLVTPLSWNSNNTPGGVSAASSGLQPDFSLGGPIKRKKAWFFVSGRYINRDDGISRTPSQLSQLTALDPSFKPFSNQARGFVFLNNATVDLSDKHRLFFLTQYDSRTQGGNFQYYAGNYAPSQYGGGAYAVRLTSTWSPRLVTRFLVSYNNKGANTSLGAIGGVPNVPEVDVYSSVSKSSGKLVGNGLIATLGSLSTRAVEPSHKTTISGDLTYESPAFLGSHEIGSGFYLQPRAEAKQTTYYSNPSGINLISEVLVNPNNPSGGVVPFMQQTVGASHVVTSDVGANDYAGYLQDRWRPTSRLTINAGLRADYISGEDLLFHVTTEKSWNYAPRIGGAYVLTKNQKNVIRANWARISDIPNSAYFGTAGNEQTSITNAYSLALNGNFNTIFTTPASTAASANVFAPHRHQGYVQEWLVGYKTQLPGDFILDISYVDREYRDRPAEVDINDIYRNGVWQGLVDPTTNTKYLITNNVWNWLVYRGIEVTATKQLSKFQFISTYTHEWQHIAGTWQPDDPAAILQPTTFADNAGIGSVRGFEPNSLTGSADTRNRMWQPDESRSAISWDAPWHLRVATSFTAQSGTPTGPVTTNLAAPNPAYGPATLRIDGRLVSNPLATTFRFAYANRGIGQLWCPWLLQWNGSVGRQFRLTERQSVTGSLDVLNIANGGAAQQFVSGANQVNSKNYGLLQNVQLPRQAQVTLRWQF